jgi:hypothetical protein
MTMFRRPPQAISTESQRRAEPVFAWLTFSRFVEVYPVQTGWLVLWGRYEQQGAVRKIVGQRVYATLDGVRGRASAAIRELTGDEALARECLVRFDRTPFPHHLAEPS